MRKFEYNNNMIVRIPMEKVNFVIVCVIIMIIILIVGLLIIQKPDNVIGHFNVYSSSLPRILKSKVDGEIVFFKSKKEKVRQGDDIAYIKTSSDYDQIKQLEIIINNKDLKTMKRILGMKKFSMLGEVATPYYELMQSFETLDNQANDKLHILNKSQTNISLKSNRESYATAIMNFRLENEQLSISRQNFEVDSALFAENAITRSQFYSTKAEYIAKIKQLKDSKLQIQQLKSQIKEGQTDVDKVGIQQNNQVNVDMTSSEYYLQILRASIKEWRNRYVLTAPCDGLIEYMPYIDDGQVIKSGEEMVQVIHKANNIKAVIYYPEVNSAGIQVGSDVKLYFDSYEKTSYGFIMSKLTTISKVITTDAEGHAYYTGETNISLSSQNNFNGKITINEGMSGQAQIIIKRKNLLKKIFNWIDILTSK